MAAARTAGCHGLTNHFRERIPRAGGTSAGTKASMPIEKYRQRQTGNGQTDEDEVPRPHLQQGPLSFPVKR